MRLVFMGSPEFAVPTLEWLAFSYEVVGVVTQPDRPAGRGRPDRPPPVKLVAEKSGIPVLQPTRLREPAAVAQLREWSPEAIVVAAYGQILPSDVLGIPPQGCINVHASLLPRWRGAAPIQAAILHGDAETGVTIMKMDKGLDTGPILSQRSTAIREEDTTGSLSHRLALAGAELLLQTLPDYLAGTLGPQPQPSEGVTYAPALTKAEGALDPRRPAAALARQVRAFEPWPGAFFDWEGRRLIVRQALAVGVRPEAAGRIGLVRGLPALGTAEGSLLLEVIQPAGRNPMPGEAFVRGARRFIGAMIAPPETSHARQGA
jgi:methionyl-tRNA formyltransferase